MNIVWKIKGSNKTSGIRNTHLNKVRTGKFTSGNKPPVTL
jgi:hypothetical protein